MAIACFLLWNGALGGATFSESFSSGSFNPLRWDSGTAGGAGVLNVANQRAEFVVTSAGGESSAFRVWRGPLPVDTDWEAVLTVNNSHAPTQGGQNSSIGLSLKHPTDPDEQVYVELYASGNDGGSDRGFLSALERSTTIFGEADAVVPGSTLAYVRISYNAAARVVTTSYDRDGPGLAHGWTTHATFGLGGSGGATGNQNWNLSNASKFTLRIGAFSEFTTVTPGSVWGDDLVLTIPGYVPPTLGIATSGANVRLRWPGKENVFRIESSTGLSPASWSLVIPTPQAVGEDLMVTLPAPATPTFYRLAY